METFSPPIPPSVSGTNKETKFRTTKVQYGDGYSQRAKDGINATDRTLNLSWTALTREEAGQIRAFLEARGGDEAFLYADPDDGTIRKWICAGFKNGYEYGQFGSFSCTLEEVWDLG